MDELGSVYRYVLAALDTTDWADLDAVYETVLPLPDGRVAAVGDWTSADVAAVRKRVGWPAHDRPIPTRSGERRRA